MIICKLFGICTSKKPIASSLARRNAGIQSAFANHCRAYATHKQIHTQNQSKFLKVKGIVLYNDDEDRSARFIIKQAICLIEDITGSSLYMAPMNAWPQTNTKHYFAHTASRPLYLKENSKISITGVLGVAPLSYKDSVETQEEQPNFEVSLSLRQADLQSRYINQGYLMLSYQKTLSLKALPTPTVSKAPSFPNFSKKVF